MREELPDPAVFAVSEPAILAAVEAVNRASPDARRDPTRPLFHFRPPAHWMNDPNGTLYHDGWYHLFYQHNPFSSGGGPMHWGHARSRNLVHWEHLPIALWPVQEGGEQGCWSGCCAINGLGDPMIFYTSIGPGRNPREAAEQWAAQGDGGLIHWKRPLRNPVLTNAVHGGLHVLEWRDPFLFRDGDRTFLLLGGKLRPEDGGDAVHLLYETRDPRLWDWKYRGILFRHPDKTVPSLECPNIVRLGSKWLMIAAPCHPLEYYVGDFDPDACSFVAAQHGYPDASAGHAYYASNMAQDGCRCILFAWVMRVAKESAWNGCLAIPRVLSLRPDGILLQDPIPELEALRGPSTRSPPRRAAACPLAGFQASCFEVRACFTGLAGSSASLRLLPVQKGAIVEIRYDGNRLSLGETSTPFPLLPGENDLTLRVFVDKSVIEVFGNRRACLTRLVDADPAGYRVEAVAHGGPVPIEVEAWPMAPIW